jgi:hypothetical protein
MCTYFEEISRHVISQFYMPLSPQIFARPPLFIFSLLNEPVTKSYNAFLA